ncbi:apolipoprotein N-acyltransferase [Streptomyces sp. ODS28]|uniref:apolipoprotein N-acyltransferase n=1 Tax=Streptomyces sp. ODS28 TaxID=3136688 RepID=UPI0031ED3306
MREARKSGAGARRAPAVRALLALLAGALPALAFPTPALWWLAWVCLVPWLLLLRSADTGRRAALYGWLGGTGFMFAVHHWLIPSLHVFTLVLAALLGALWAPWGWLARRLLGGVPDGPSGAEADAASGGAANGAPRAARFGTAALLLPAGWLLVELVRSWQFLGGPWGLLGASQWQVGPALRLASVGGVWLISFLVVAVNVGVTALLVSSRGRVAGAVTLVLAVAATTAAWAWAPRPAEDPGRTARIGVIQAGEQAPTVEQRYQRSAQLTREMAHRGQRPDLVVWGESSIGVDLGAHPRVRARLAALSAEVGAPLLVNVDARRADGHGIFKSSVLITPHGPTGPRYDKMRLVPFGEYVPFRSVLGWATSVGKAAGEDRMRGTEPVMMRAGGLRFGPLICFETAFPDMSRHLVRQGAQLLVAQSSTATFQHSWAPAQHASLAALRGAESGRPMVHATLTGESAVYGGRGEALGPRMGVRESGTRVYGVPSTTGTTLYVRFGDWVPYGCLAGVAAYAFLAGARAVRRNQAPSPVPGEPAPNEPAPAER